MFSAHQADAARDRARPISAPTSAAIRLRPSRRSRSAIRSSATACRWRAPRRSTPNMEKRPIAIMGDGGFWHNGADHRRRLEPVQQRRRRADRDAERLRLRHRPAIHPVEHGEPRRRRRPASTSSRRCARMGVKWLRTVRSYSVAKMVDDAEGGDADRRARPEGDHRRRRMPARAPAPRARRGCRQAQARRARDAHALRRRRRDLHRRSFLHPAVRLPVADGEAHRPIRCAPIRWRP